MTPRHIAISLGAVLATAVPAAGCGGSGPSASAGGAATPAPSAKTAGAGATAVTIDNFKFAPPTLTVKRGAQIVVTNRDSTAHTATADGHAFDTGDITPGASATVRLTKPGRYAYHCSIHPFMHGTLVVQ